MPSPEDQSGIVNHPGSPETLGCPMLPWSAALLFGADETQRRQARRPHPPHGARGIRLLAEGDRTHLSARNARLCRLFNRRNRVGREAGASSRHADVPQLGRRCTASVRCRAHRYENFCGQSKSSDPGKTKQALFTTSQHVLHSRGAVSRRLFLDNDSSPGIASFGVFFFCPNFA
jgi:hypothetical protein